MWGIARATVTGIMLLVAGTLSAVDAGSQATDECRLRVVNRRDVAFTVVWGSLLPGTGYVTYGVASDALDQTACDNRDPSATCDRVGSTHFIEVEEGIEPSTTYFVQAFADGSPFGELMTVVSGRTLAGIPPTDTVFGPVVLFDGSTAATGAIVCATIEDADGQGSPGSSTSECDTVLDADQGFWNANLGNARTQDLQESFSYNLGGGDQVLLEACGGTDGLAQQTVTTADDTPAPQMTLVVPPDDQPWCADMDSDGFGDPENMVMAPTPPEGFVGDCSDCDDTQQAINPAADEICDELDNDCDDEIDVDAVDAPTWWVDGDFDGYGDPDHSTVSCLQPPDTVDNDLDCDDQRKDVNPDSDEVCRDGIDNDCNGLIDELPSCPTPDACRLQVVDRGAEGFRVVWGSNAQTSGYLMYGTSAGSLTEMACDDRDPSSTCEFVDDTHFISVGQLEPSTTYFVQAMADGQPFENQLIVNTGPVLPDPLSDPIFGTVVQQDGETPADGTYVCATIRSIDGAGSPGASTAVCDLLAPEDEGLWTNDLGYTLRADLQDHFNYDPSDDEVFEEACGGLEGTASQKVPTSDDSPSPVLVVRPPCVEELPCDTGEPGICRDGLTVCEGDLQICVPNLMPADDDPCDGLDNDCDADVDEDFQTDACDTGEPGVCAAGLSECVDGGEVCLRITEPTDEVCNGQDDDCDLGIDEELPSEPCDTGQLGVCAEGTTSCDSGLEVCIPAQEPASSDPCNGQDDDCDGDEDEDFVSESCDTGQLGVCAAGTGSCNAGQEECVPDNEPALADADCNGQDDDCDGDEDEDFVPGACDSGQLGICAAGSSTCSEGMEECSQVVEPTEEICNMLDDDCDGEVDEQLDCTELACPLRVVNLRSTSFSVVWGTQQSSVGFVAVGTSPENLTDEVCDVRDDAPPCGFTSDTHFVSLLNLLPETTYYVQAMGAGEPVGDLLVVETGPILSPSTPDLAFGQLFLPDMTTRAAGSYVCATIRDEDGEGSQGSSTPLCGLVNAQEEGFWSVSLTDARTKDLANRFEFSDTDDVVFEDACGAVDGCANQTVLTANSAPSPDLTLGDECCPLADVDVTCDGIDDDCDGEIDEDYMSTTCRTDGLGACEFGMSVCEAGTESCIPDNEPMPETCNGIDDDCDGEVDNGIQPVECDTGTPGICGPGLLTCGSGMLQCLPLNDPMPETCNGLDDDCDGEVDNGIEPVACETGEQGVCAEGLDTCVAGGFVCVPLNDPSDEVCDGLDNDCDGEVDNGIEPVECDTGDPGVCAEGLDTCVAGGFVCVPLNDPSDEVCDGVDNDCDGEVDNGIEPVECDTGDPGVCAEGLDTCVDGGFVCIPLNDPSDEVCDGVDNDCDGEVDNGIEPVECDTGDPGECAEGLDTCVAGGFVCIPLNDPGDEVCDGVDNDCDGEVDNGIEPVECDTGDPGVCAEGLDTCVDGGFVCIPLNDPGDEVCDGLDNDCDGEVDNGIEPVECDTGDPGVCADGLGVCVDGGLVCVRENDPMPEECNGLDDDCDGDVDNDIEVVECDSGEPGVCADGLDICVDGDFVCIPENEPMPEECNGLDDDCDGEVDNDIEPVECDTGDPGVCAEGRDRCQDGQLLCVPVNEPMPESCNGLDDDCDGEVDNGIETPECDTGEPGVCAEGLDTCVGGGFICIPLDEPMPEQCNGLDDDCNGVIDDADPPCLGADCESLRVSKTVSPEFLRAPRAPGCFMDGEPTSLTFEYTGAGCQGSDNEQTADSCSGSGTGEKPVLVSAAGGDRAGSLDVPYMVDPRMVAIGEEFTIFTPVDKLEAYSTLELSGGVEETIGIVTSCEQTLQVGDSFGSLTLVAFSDLRASEHEVLYTYEIKHDEGLLTDVRVWDDKLGVIEEGFELPGGETLKLFEPGYVTRTTTNTVVVSGDARGERCTASDSATVVVWRPPVCTDTFPRALHMTYTGGACEAAVRRSAVGPKSCSGGLADADTVWIVVSDRPDMWEPGAFVWYVGLVEKGGPIRINAKPLGRVAIDSELYVTIHDAGWQPLQQLMLPAPCDDSVSAGGRFGAIRIDRLEIERGR